MLNTPRIHMGGHMRSPQATDAILEILNSVFYKEKQLEIPFYGLLKPIEVECGLYAPQNTAFLAPWNHHQGSRCYPLKVWCPDNVPLAILCHWLRHRTCPIKLGRRNGQT